MKKIITAKKFTHFLLVMAMTVSTASVLPASAQDILKMSTTTSTENSGLLKFLLPAFEVDTKIKVQVIAVGSGKALELAKNGDVDVTLVHARDAEDQFVAAGYGVNRRDVMYNDFVVVGPEQDPAGVKKETDLLAALKRIIASQVRFISRGDNSGTDVMEQKYWKQLGDKPKATAYVSAGLGMGEVLTMAAEMQAYTLSDRATYAAYKAKTGLKIVLQSDKRMLNPYGIIAVNPQKYPDIHYAAAMKLINWITSDAGKKKIAEFRANGEQVFFPY
ncbi:substrate-binding domain-containing protein [Undibacterium flavidum]|uniref:Substrate-binding domain-containing protein n=1 Tax=Undibacterium flavidum TaxID=2762297 RepID=A0ABR6Y7G6_9BURK|nr:substrate-binding domain-containing protein [Undibacterium flavidum]MBC3872561.1 substrate-binding domain-containing protein [Undibacterium flavidum]